jgi:hypothetical protein
VSPTPRCSAPAGDRWRTESFDRGQAPRGSFERAGSAPNALRGDRWGEEARNERGGRDELHAGHGGGGHGGGHGGSEPRPPARPPAGLPVQPAASLAPSLAPRRPLTRCPTSPHRAGRQPEWMQEERAGREGNKKMTAAEMEEERLRFQAEWKAKNKGGGSSMFMVQVRGQLGRALLGAVRACSLGARQQLLLASNALEHAHHPPPPPPPPTLTTPHPPTHHGRRAARRRSTWTSSGTTKTTAPASGSSSRARRQAAAASSR